MSSIREAGSVKRYHTVQTHGDQTVAEHSFHVCMILTQIVENPSAELLKAALYHDLPEVDTGDMPATTKWRYPKLAEELEIAELDFITRHGLSVKLHDREWLALKYADMCELVQFCVDQLNLGNRNMLVIANRGLDFLGTLPFCSAKASELVESLKHQVENFK